jgi:hypothetical protein
MMTRLLAAISFALIAWCFLGMSVASADTWGCSYEKCLQVCAKAGGKYCSNYCSKELKDKQIAKKCQ